jgi:DNA-binding cell septation regulator SpoVG
VTAQHISNAIFTSYHAPADGGLLGFVAVTFAGALRIDGIAVRRTLDGRVVLSFPERRDASGRRHPIVRPLDAACRAAIEAQIFALLGISAAATGAAARSPAVQAGGAP